MSVQIQRPSTRILTLGTPGLSIVQPVAAAGAPAWVPSDLTDLVAWYDASDATTLFTDAGSTQVSSDGDLIYQWNDKSASGFNLTQTTSGSRPTYKTAIKNSRSVARFASDYMTRPAWSASTSEYTVAFVLANITASGRHDLTDSSARTVMLMNRYYSDQTKNGIRYGAFATGQAIGNNSSNDHILLFRLAAGTGTAAAYVNGGSAAGTANYTAVAFTSGTLGSYYDGSQDYYLGDMCEIVVCDAALSTSDMNSLGGYLGTKWGITWTDIT